MSESSDHSTRERELLSLVERLRERIAEIDAYAHAAEAVVLEPGWRLNRNRRLAFRRLHQFVDDAARTARDALEEADGRMSRLYRSRR